MPAWTKEEDEVLTTAVRLYGVKAWSIVACALRGRTGKQCRERYQHQLLHSKTVKTSAALLATERKFSNTYESTAHMLRQAFSTNSKQLRVDTSTACLSAVDRTLEETFGGDDAPHIETPRKRVRYLGHLPGDSLQRYAGRSPWSAPPRAFDPACGPDTPVFELTTLGLPRVDFSEEVELGSHSELKGEPQAAGRRRDTDSRCLLTMPSSSVDWDALVAIGSAIASPASVRTSHLEQSATVGPSYGTAWHVDAFAPPPTQQHNPEDEAFLRPRPAVKLTLVQAEGKDMEEFDVATSGDTATPKMISTDDQMEQCLVQLGSRFEISPLATSFCSSVYPSSCGSAATAPPGAASPGVEQESGPMSLCGDDGGGRSVRIVTDSERVAQQTAQRERPQIAGISNLSGISNLGPVTRKAQKRDSEIQRGYVHRQLLHRLLDQSAASPS